MKIIPVLSGKGGVGKTCTAVNIAFQLKELGKSVAIADADVTGPSVPKFLNINFHEVETTRAGVIPYVKNGVEVFSTSFLMKNEDTPAMLKGTMRASFIQQMLDTVQWSAKFLVLDLPPGSGDEVTYLLKRRRKDIRCVVVVTTPSDKSTAQVRKSLSLCRNLEIPILGIIVNQSETQCPKCQYTYSLYPQNGYNPVEKMSKDYNIPVIASIPFSLDAERNPLVLGKYLRNVAASI